MIDWIEKQDKKYYMDACKKRGINLLFDSTIISETRDQILSFVNYIKKNYFFPIRMNVRLCNKLKFKHPDDGHVYYAVFFDNEENYLVFDYLEDNVTSYKIYMNYNTIDSAVNTLDIIKVNYSDNKDIESVTREGQYIVITYTKDYVKEHYTTITELRKTLSSLTEVKE